MSKGHVQEIKAPEIRLLLIIVIIIIIIIVIIIKKYPFFSYHHHCAIVEIPIIIKTINTS